MHGHGGGDALPPDSISQLEIAPNSVGTGELQDGSVTVNKLASNIQPGASNLRVPGEIVAYGGSAAPVGWLMCDGALVLQGDYPSLFAVIGHTANNGIDPGGGRFKLPDLKGRVIVGSGAGTGLTNRILGSSGGEENHTMIQAEMPAHAHTASTLISGAHNHNPPNGFAGGVGGAGPPPFFAYVQDSATPGAYDLIAFGAGAKGSFPVTNYASSTDTQGSHTHSITMANAGSGSPHNNVQPFQSFNYIIKT
jgi:microcystin-dependent protein